MIPKILEKIENKIRNSYLPDEVKYKIDRAIEKVVEEKRKGIGFEFIVEKEQKEED